MSTITDYKSQVMSYQSEGAEHLHFSIEWQVFRFLKGHIPWFTATAIFTVFWDFTQRFLRNKCLTVQRSAATYNTTLTHEVFVKILEQFNNFEIFNEEFYFRIS